MEKFYVIDDNRAKVREAFVISENEVDELNYSRYYTVGIFDIKEEAKSFCEEFNNYADIEDFYVVDDESTEAREAFIVNALELAVANASYSHYFVVAEFDNKEDADKFCETYNSYDGPDVELCCCSKDESHIL